MKRKCVVCDKELPSWPTKGNAREILVMLGFCEEHQPEPEPERDVESEWDEVSRRILLCAARGELLDADGNPVPAISYCDGVLHHYAVDLFGELVEVKP